MKGRGDLNSQIMRTGRDLHANDTDADAQKQKSRARILEFALRRTSAMDE